MSLQSAPDNTIGGTAAGAGNLISGNVGDGVLVQGSAATGRSHRGNEIGTNAACTAAIANSAAGVEIQDASGDTMAARPPWRQTLSPEIPASVCRSISAGLETSWWAAISGPT